MQSDKHGIIAGYFDPLHNGHLALIEIARSISCKLVVLVLDNGERWCHVDQSVTWLRACLSDDIAILAPEAHRPDALADWITQNNPDANVVFGCNDLTASLADALGIPFYHVDKAHDMIGIGRGDIRNNLKSYWFHMPKAVRATLQRRICFVGPESVGKTTMARQIAQELNTAWCPEYGRIYTENHKAHDDPWSDTDLIDIAAGHIIYRQNIMASTGPLLIEDTDVLQTIIWARYLLKSTPDALLDYVKPHGLADYYYLLNPDMPWRDDGVRYTRDLQTRIWFFEQIQALLEHYKCPYQIVKGSGWQERYNHVLSDLKNRL